MAHQFGMDLTVTCLQVLRLTNELLREGFIVS